MMVRNELDVHSPVIEPEGVIPRRYTGDGENLSPPLEWSGVPAEAKELALIVEDPDAPGPEPFAHWVVCHIPPGITRLEEGASSGALPEGAVEGRNSFRKDGYGGPAPPPGKPHHYHFRVLALDAPLTADAGVDRRTLLEEAEGHVIAQGDLVGTYARK